LASDSSKKQTKRWRIHSARGLTLERTVKAFLPKIPILPSDQLDLLVIVETCQKIPISQTIRIKWTRGRWARD
jgi:hypothetical protein